MTGSLVGWMYKIDLDTCWGSFYQYNVQDEYEKLVYGMLSRISKIS